MWQGPRNEGLKALDKGGQGTYRPRQLALHRGAIRPSQGGRIAQVVEQLTLNQRVVGSSPTAPTNNINMLVYIL